MSDVRLTTLHNMLFAELEMLANMDVDEINPDTFKKESERIAMMNKVSSNIIQNANLIFKSVQYQHDQGFVGVGSTVPKMLDISKNDNR